MKKREVEEAKRGKDAKTEDTRSESSFSSFNEMEVAPKKKSPATSSSKPVPVLDPPPGVSMNITLLNWLILSVLVF